LSKGRSDGEETKKRIIAHAKQLFVQKGYGAVTMNEVCAAAGASKGSLYHHFPSKDELFIQVSEEDARQWNEDWERIRAAIGTTEEQLYALAEHYANDFQNPLLKALEEYARSRVITEEIVERMLRIGDANSQACREVLRQGMERGEFAEWDLDRIVVIVSSLFEGLSKIYYSFDRDKEQDLFKQHYRDAVRFALDGIRAKPI